MAVKICECIGICRTDEDGNIAELQREFFGQGWVFKDWEAFRSVRMPLVMFRSLTITYIQQMISWLCATIRERLRKSCLMKRTGRIRLRL